MCRLRHPPTPDGPCTQRLPPTPRCWIRPGGRETAPACGSPDTRPAHLPNRELLGKKPALKNTFLKSSYRPHLSIPAACVLPPGWFQDDVNE